MSAKHTKTTSRGADGSAPAMDWAAFDSQTDEEIEAAVANDPRTRG